MPLPPSPVSSTTASTPVRRRNGAHMDPKDRKQSWTMSYIVLAVMGVVLLQQFWAALPQAETIAYSEFEQLVAAKQVTEVVVGPDTIRGALKSPLPNGKSQFTTTRVDIDAGR